MTTVIFKSQSRLYPTRRVPLPDQFAEATHSLAKIVQAAAWSAQAGMRDNFAQHAGAGPPFAPRQLLVLLSYCYAHQIYSSRVIERMLRRDEDVVRLCPAGLPDREDLLRFRNENREALHFCLTAALRFLFEKKVAAGLVTRMGEAQLAEEANRRIITAIFLDSMGVEGEEAPVGSVDLCYLVANSSARVH